MGVFMSLGVVGRGRRVDSGSRLRWSKPFFFIKKKKEKKPRNAGCKNKKNVIDKYDIQFLI